MLYSKKIFLRYGLRYKSLMFGKSTVRSDFSFRQINTKHDNKTQWTYKSH